jgi:3-hydroxyisobutyrate dehydrogenase
MRVGFIGVGNIGRPMAEQIARAGFDLTVHDLRKEAAAPLLDSGATWAKSPREVAERSDVVSTCVPGPAEMEPAVLGENGILAGLRPGAVYVDHTTNSLALVRRVHDELAARGFAMLDAPVSGGVEGARTRDLAMFVGGDAGTLERCRPVLDAMAKKVIHAGDIGAGCVCKVAHNCASFTRTMALMECLTLGVKAGVSADVLIDAFNKGAVGTNLDLRVRLPATVFAGDFEPRFALKTAVKDMTLATELAIEVGVPVRLAEACRAEYQEALERGLGDLDSTAVHTLLLQEERARVQVRLG